jgi:hypothetical protein
MRLAHRGLAAASVLWFAAAARAQNLVPDPAFRNGLGAWSPSAISGNYTMSFAPGVSVRPGSGSALLNVDGPAGGTYFVCVAVAGGRTYEWGHSMFFPDASRTVGLVERLDAYDGPACTGSLVGGNALQIVPGSIGGWFGGTALVFPAPASCRSILVGFAAVAPPGTKATAYVDDVYLAEAGTVPPIEPAPAADVPALSPAVLCALAGALLLAGTRALRS